MPIFSAKIGDGNAGLELTLITATGSTELASEVWRAIVGIYEQSSTKSAYQLLRNADNLSILQQPYNSSWSA
jgi:hypothetical protein